MLTHRLAREEDLPQLRELAGLAIDTLQRDVLTPEQVVASRQIMGIDSRLVADGTYFVVERDGVLAGCGGWSMRRATYGGDHSAGRDQARLDPARDPARIRAMYTHPDHVRRGVGRLVLSLSEAAARAAGFRALELLATLSGLRLYRSSGFAPIEDVVEDVTGAGIPLVRMGKSIGHPVAAGAVGGPPCMAASRS
ncbi:GNAT family N-acetyltransferase [Actinomycetospora cinnamomea]|uniref:N-acetylglutamate synthase-like GNAT family acetyltransferase n=1 Tax=Actinomycetospora cinnamomea TaxID=663609 RepID=A0A2U1FQH7_9PSEU|nr:GNAT family N-acetyltransferase [Actinomycetospora cinnamomea]PVZ14362.1 N-acetylglutamate synthase-like GNAT family acetyltransferase [Actinomycetospora cinnamomea]